MIAPYRLQGLPVRVEMFSSFENSEFEDFHQWLHTQDQTLFGYLQEAICSKLGIVPTQRFGCRLFDFPVRDVRYMD